MSERPTITTAHKWLIGGVVVGALVIASIGFAGSFTAVRELAERKHFGDFSPFFPIGLDAGIVVLLALDFLLTWLRMPFAGLRPMAWLLTAATIAFNAAVAWPDPTGVGMHGVIPLLFVVVVEAARSAMCKIANIDAGRHIETIPLRRWLLAPWPSFRLMRRMHMWQIRKLDEAVALEQKALIFAAEMRHEYGRRWRRKAPRAAIALRLATKYGAALDDAASFITPSPVAAPAPKQRPERPAPKQRPAPSEGAPKQGAPSTEGAPKGETPRPRPEGAKRPAPDTEGAPREGDAPKVPTRESVKTKIRALYAELGRRPGEGEIVKVLEAEALCGYEFTSRRHAQTLRKEIEADRPELAARGSANVRPFRTGTDG